HYFKSMLFDVVGYKGEGKELPRIMFQLYIPITPSIRVTPLHFKYNHKVILWNLFY
ncbi:hypothetical protein J6590_038741, partial [Homalodisca vitripennis]